MTSVARTLVKRDKTNNILVLNEFQAFIGPARIKSVFAVRKIQMECIS